MKKLLLSIFTAISFGSFAQTILLQEDFTTYLAAGPAPIGWFTSSNGNYTTASSSGLSGPNSYKFGVNNATVISPQFAAGNDSLSFWIKLNGSGTPANDTLSTLYVYESNDSTLFTIVDSIKNIPTSTGGITKTFGLLATSKWVKFIYGKIGGNLAFDDFKVTQYAPVGVINKLNNLDNVSVFGTYGNININSTSSLSAYITIYSLNGEKLVSSKMTEEKTISINMNNYSEGLYLVIISNKEGSISRKINLMK